MKKEKTEPVLSGGTIRAEICMMSEDEPCKGVHGREGSMYNGPEAGKGRKRIVADSGERGKAD